MSTASTAAASSAAAAARRRMRQEEEEMTTYTSQDLSEGWEFKILRSIRGAFKDPIRLKQILEEEGRAGWVLVEKFDDGRIRLKRPASASKFDANLGFDAYRTYVGMSENKFALVVVGIAIAFSLGIIISIVAFAKAR